jgi:tripartite-type tricarboxylate transporter receptor subunit TctC
MARCIASSLLVIALWAFPAIVHAQGTWPERPIRWIVTHAAGGASDAICRLVAERLSEILGKRVVVENRAGGGTVTGTTEIGRSAADGYTIGFAADSFAINTAAGTQQIDTNKMIQPLIRLMGYQFMVLTNAERVPMRTFPEFAAHAKKNPDWLTFGSLGPNSTHELVFRGLENAAGFKSVMVNYRGVGPALNDLVGGHVMSMLTGVGIADPYIESGKVNALAVTGTHRLASSPNVPTVAEQGYGNFNFEGWYGVIVPRGIPAPILQRLNTALNEALQSPQIKSRIEALGGEVAGGTIAEFETLVARDIVRYRELLPSAQQKAPL